jgi:hypothetical protein
MCACVRVQYGGGAYLWVHHCVYFSTKKRLFACCVCVCVCARARVFVCMRVFICIYIQSTACQQHSRAVN